MLAQNFQRAYLRESMAMEKSQSMQIGSSLADAESFIFYLTNSSAEDR